MLYRVQIHRHNKLSEIRIGVTTHEVIEMHIIIIIIIIINPRKNEGGKN